MTASDSVILPINYIIWRKSGPVLTGPTGPAPTPLEIYPIRRALSSNEHVRHVLLIE